MLNQTCLFIFSIKPIYPFLYYWWAEPLLKMWCVHFLTYGKFELKAKSSQLLRTIVMFVIGMIRTSMGECIFYFYGPSLTCRKVWVGGNDCCWKWEFLHVTNWKAVIHSLNGNHFLVKLEQYGIGSWLLYYSDKVIGYLLTDIPQNVCVRLQDLYSSSIWWAVYDLLHFFFFFFW